MRLYKVIYTTQQRPTPRLLWATSEAGAKKEAARLKRENKTASSRDSLISCGVIAVDVPTNKAGLVQWMNTHVTQAPA